MDGDHALSATIIDEFTHQGKTYKLGVLTRSDWANIERELVKDRPSPLAIVVPHLAKLPEDQQKMLLEKAYEDERLGPRMRAGEMEEWLGTLEGGRTRFYHSLQKHHPEVSRDQSDALFEVKAKQDWEKMQERLGAANGFPQGKESGPPTDGDEKESLGGPSTDSSDESTAGLQSKSDE